MMNRHVPRIVVRLLDIRDLQDLRQARILVEEVATRTIASHATKVVAVIVEHGT